MPKRKIVPVDLANVDFDTDVDYAEEDAAREHLNYWHGKRVPKYFINGDLDDYNFLDPQEFEDMEDYQEWRVKEIDRLNVERTKKHTPLTPEKQKELDELDQWKDSNKLFTSKRIAKKLTRNQLLDMWAHYESVRKALDEERKQLGYRKFPGFGGKNPFSNAEQDHWDIRKSVSVKLDWLQEEINRLSHDDPRYDPEGEDIIEEEKPHYPFNNSNKTKIAQKSEQEVAKSMKEKGYNYIVQIQDSDAEPLYTKTMQQTSELLRTDLKNNRTNVMKIDEFLSKKSASKQAIGGMFKLEYPGIRKSDETIDLADVEPTGQAELTSRVLPAPWNKDEEWQEPAKLPDGRKCWIIYQFDPDEIANGLPEDYPWDEDHVTKIVLDTGDYGVESDKEPTKLEGALKKLWDESTKKQTVREREYPKPTPGEEVYVEQGDSDREDEDPDTWYVFGLDSGHAYGSYGSKAGAEEHADRMNTNQAYTKPKSSKKQAAKMPGLFNSDYKKWLQMEAKILAMNAGTASSQEEAELMMDKSIDKLVDMVADSVENEIYDVVDEVREDIIEEMVKKMQAQEVPVEALPEIEEPKEEISEPAVQAKPIAIPGSSLSKTITKL